MIKTYTIYNASAGAGKTYTLVLEFLKIILKRPKDTKIKNILAITFTNKAANEMKQRIISSLIELAEGKESKYENQLIDYLKVNKDEIHLKAKEVLTFILHNYSLFSVSTMDKFNFRILRAFSKEFQLPSKFSVEMNQNHYIEEAINELTSKIGTNNQYAKILMDFALNHYDENEKRLNFRKELNERIKDYLKEKNYFLVYLLKDKTIEDFKNLEKLVNQRIKNNTLKIKQNCENALEITQSNLVKNEDFAGGKQNGIGILFEKIHNLIINNELYEKLLPSTTNIEKCIEKGVYHASKVKKQQIELVEEVFLKLYPLLIEIYQLYEEFLIDKKIKKELVNMQTNSEINLLLNELKKEQEIVFISDANPIINNNLQNEKSNYIYEKIGTRYEHLFFDEFQDTSELQWENFLPLVENTINQAHHSVFLVGDVKQSIYRFKGGKPELLLNEMEKIQNENLDLGEVIQLPDNYRSNKNIVDFNNRIYTKISRQISEEKYKKVYEKSYQYPKGKEGGNVQVAFFSSEDYHQTVENHILHIINETIKKGYSYKDIAILFRGKKEAKSLASVLIDNKIKVLSEDSLFLNQVICIRILLELLNYLDNPKNKTSLFQASYLLHQELITDDEKDFSEWFYQIKNLPNAEITKQINFYFKLELSLNKKEFLNTYDLVEELIRGLNFKPEYHTYFSTFLNVIFNFESNGAKSIVEFLEYWENEGENIKYHLPEKDDSVQIMTIHKSKGLEFPVVILPFYNSTDKNEPNWYELNPEKYAGFETFYMSFNKDEKKNIPSFSSQFEKYEAEKKLDDLNVNYVSTTRAEKEMFLIFPINKEEKIELATAIKEEFGILVHESSEQIIQNLYVNEEDNFIKKSNISKETKQIFHWISNSWNTKFYLTTKNQELLSDHFLAFEFGNLVHDLLSKISHQKDVEQIYNQAIVQGIIPTSIQEKVKQILIEVTHHNKLKEYFTASYKKHSEREMIFNGNSLRSDLLVETPAGMVIIDYKTGKFHPSHIKQLELYEQALTSFGKKVAKKLLILIGNEIEIKEF
jgi:ATP-dependent exoDNAse (exonuclease V) beta subunit